MKVKKIFVPKVTLLVKTNLILLVILFVGLFLRLYGLGEESLWFDEGFTLMYAKLDFFQIIKTISSTTRDLYLSQSPECFSNPPLYYIISHFSIALLGESEFALRIPSVIFGFFSILMIYKIGILLYNKNVGLISALILALSKFHIYYSQEARSYSLQVLLLLLSFYFFIKLLEKRNRTNSIGYIISSVLLIYTHYFGIFIIVSQNIIFIILFLLSRGIIGLNFKSWILLQCTLIMLYMPWILVIINQLLVSTGFRFHLPIPPINSIYYTFLEYSGGSTLLIALFILLTFFSIVNIIKDRGKAERIDFLKPIEDHSRYLKLSNINIMYLLLLWLSISIVLPLIISYFIISIYSVRYTIGVSLPFYLLVAHGIENINSRNFMKLAAIIFMMFLLIVLERFLY